MTDSRQRLHAQVFGYVQGVSFRYYTCVTANSIGVKGWVRNRGNGSVEVVAEGTRDQLDELLRFLNTGPAAASVSQVQVDWLTATGEFTDFQIN